MSNAVRANGTVAAGCSCALALAKLLVHAAIAMGGRQHVLEQFPQAMSHLVAALQRRQLVVNWGKVGYMTSSTDLDGDVNQRRDL
eukprot:6346005-Pyramimonas_sp.AAC.1